MSTFSLNEDAVRKAFMLTKSVALETFEQCFQFKILKYILFLNSRLAKIGMIQSDICNFCEASQETVEQCTFSTSFFAMTLKTIG